ncbi:MAG TPA: flagellar protein FlgN [Clostridiaceae bacterium]|nr:flagellar protein FlgN [Clostridiaceae bacterium]
MVASLIDKLIDILEQENEIYTDILNMSKNKTDIIVKGKISELENIVKLEQSYIARIGKLENEREEIVEKIARQLVLDKDDINISGIIKKLDQENAARLKTCRESIMLTLKELKSVNELNSNLTKNSLEYIDFSINLLASIDSTANNYSNSGRVNDPKKRSFLDMKL